MVSLVSLVLSIFFQKAKPLSSACGKINTNTNLKPLHVCSSQQIELKNASLRAGDQLKVKLFILHDAERCAIQTHAFYYRKLSSYWM